MIVFSAKMGEKHKEQLRERFPKQTFIFCDSILEAMDYAAEAEIYVTFAGRADLEEKFIKSAKNLKWLVAFSAGVNKFPLEWMEENGIMVTNVSGIHKIPMSEYVISMLLQVYRHSKQTIANEAKGIWERSGRMHEISGRKMLILGTGNIGSETARLAKAFRMRTIGVSKSGSKKEYFDEVYTLNELDQLLPEADFIISILPSTEETRYLFNYEKFELMNEKAVFLNMGRGDAVVEAELLRAIRNKEIAHAVLDVFVEEPLEESHPFWTEENITVTPHNSSLSPAYVWRAREIFEKNLEKYEAGESDFINLVDHSRGY